MSNAVKCMSNACQIMSNSCLRFLGTSVKPCQPLSNMSKRHRTPPPRDDMVDQKPNGKLEKIWPPAADDKIPPDRSTMGANADLKNRAACEAGPGKFCPVPPGPRPPEPLCQIPSKLRRASAPLSNYCRSVKSRRPRRLPVKTVKSVKSRQNADPSRAPTARTPL